MGRKSGEGSRPNFGLSWRQTPSPVRPIPGKFGRTPARSAKDLPQSWPPDARNSDCWPRFRVSMELPRPNEPLLLARWRRDVPCRWPFARAIRWETSAVCTHKCAARAGGGGAPAARALGRLLVVGRARGGAPRGAVPAASGVAAGALLPRPAAASVRAHAEGDEPQTDPDPTPRSTPRSTPQARPLTGPRSTPASSGRQPGIAPTQNSARRDTSRF